MKKSQVIFKAVDIFMKEPQNSVSFENIFCEKDIPYSDNGGEYTMGDMYYPPRQSMRSIILTFFPKLIILTSTELL